MMYNDFLDVVIWVVEEKIVDEDCVVIMGGSYGGYVMLVGLMFMLDIFVCGVDIVGLLNFVSLFENFFFYWMLMMLMMKLWVGDWMLEDGKVFLEFCLFFFKV